MKKIFFLIIFIIPFNSLADDIQKFKIEGMSIGDSALNYFSESQLEKNEQGWHNYDYKEYSTSLMPGKNIYDWFLVSYKSYDDNFIMEALIGGFEKINYSNEECNNMINSTALKISGLFKNTKKDKKKKYELSSDASRTFPFTGKSTVTSLSFKFLDKGEIILACYEMDKEANQNDSFITPILNQNDTFRIDVRSQEFVNYLKRK